MSTYYTHKILQNTIWVIGCARSGTTITGKILSSLKTVEYGFEPETLFGLLPLINKINKKYWKETYEHYLVEDLFFNLCVGRKINLRRIDDSSIYNSLSKKQIENKLKLNLRREDLELYLKKNKKNLIIKVPDLSKSLVKLQKYYPKNKFIVTMRNHKSIAASLVKKGWFKKKINKTNPKIYDNKNFFDSKTNKIWNKVNEKEKINIYINLIEKYLKKLKNKHIVNYEDLVKDPNNEIKKICKFLNLTKTKKTDQIIKQIYYR